MEYSTLGLPKNEHHENLGVKDNDFSKKESHLNARILPRTFNYFKLAQLKQYLLLSRPPFWRVSIIRWPSSLQAPQPPVTHHDS